VLPQEIKDPSKKERDLSNRPDGYKTMGVSGEAIEHPSDLTKIPGRILKTHYVTGLRKAKNIWMIWFVY
jgi:hypothetical protein